MVFRPRKDLGLLKKHGPKALKRSIQGAAGWCGSRIFRRQSTLHAAGVSQTSSENGGKAPLLCGIQRETKRKPNHFSTLIWRNIPRSPWNISQINMGLKVMVASPTGNLRLSRLEICEGVQPADLARGSSDLLSCDCHSHGRQVRLLGSSFKQALKDSSSHSAIHTSTLTAITRLP